MEYKILTLEFFEKMRTNGQIAIALRQLSSDLAIYKGLPRMSTWELVCEKMVDTDYGSDYFLRVAAELRRRGLADSEIEKMRMFAWHTAGWLNFEKMMGEWIGLDERDIRRALELQRRDNEITEQELQESLSFLRSHEGSP
jgi:hypothetical protein